jgi:hypothetical protein
MLFNLELIIANAAFFFTYCVLAAGYARTSALAGTPGYGCTWPISLMKLLSFAYNSLLSRLFSNLGTGGGRFGLSITI